MASIARRPDGKYRARYRDPSGVEHAKHDALKHVVQRWLDEQTAAMVTGQYVHPTAGRVKFRPYAEDLRAAMAHGPTTRNLVERTLRRHVYPALGELPMATIRTTTVQGLMTELAGRLAPSTLKLVHGYVVAVFRAAVRDKVIAASPCDGVVLPAARRRQVEVLPLEVVDVLAANLPPRFRVVPALVAGCGLRQGELFGLELGRIEFLGRRAVDVAQQLVTLTPDPPYLGKVKTPESERLVPLAEVTLAAVAEHLAEFPAGEVELWDRTDPNHPTTRTARRHRPQ